MKTEKPIEERTLAIVAMGGSHRDYFFYNFDKEKPGNVADEVWAINSIALVMKCDMAVMMDDMKMMEANPKRKRFTDRIKTELADTPLLTSRAYPEYPQAIQYPLSEVLSKFQIRYLNGSVAYALAYALHMGYKHILLYGCDYMYDNKPGIYERGRGCVEFWIAVGTFVCGANIQVAESSTLMDTANPSFYGYWEQPNLEAVPDPDRPGEFNIEHKGWIPRKQSAGPAVLEDWKDL